MPQGLASVSEETKINTLMSMGYSRSDADAALREAHSDVGEAMVLLANRRRGIQAGPPGGTRGRRGSPRGRSRRSPPRHPTTLHGTTLENPYAKAVMTESARKGLSYLLPAPVGAMVTQMIDVYLKGSDDSGVEDIKRRVEIIERHVGLARIKNKSKKKDKSKRKKRKTKRKPKK